MTKRNTISGISINPNYIALATADLDEGVVLNMSLQPLDADIEDNWERIDAGLQTLFETLKLKGEDVALTLPAEFALIKIMEVEPEEDNVDEFLKWELSQQIVGNIDDYVFDFEKILSASEDEPHRYFITAYRKTAVDNIVQLFKKHKQNPVIVEPDAFSLINVHQMNYSEDIAEPVLIIFSESDFCKIILGKDGHYLDMHSVSVVEPENPFSDDTKASCERLLKLNGITVEEGEQKVFLTGDYFNSEETVEKVKEIYPQTKLFSPFNKIKNLTGWKEEDLAKYLPRLALAVGLAMRDAETL